MRKLGMMAAAAAMTASSLYAGEGIEINKFLTIGGFIDMAYVKTDKDVAAGATISTDTATFGMNQAEVDFHFNFGNGLMGRIDLDGGTTTPTKGGGGTDPVDIEQARIDLDLGSAKLTMGKWDTFIGLEGLEPTDLYQHSNSLTYGLQPGQQTGISLSLDGGVWNGALALVNGLAVQNTDNNDAIAFQLHLGLTPWEGLAFNLNWATADEGLAGGAATTALNEVETTLLTFDIQYSMNSWVFGFEYVTREADSILVVDNEDTAMMLMANYSFTEQFSLTGRYSVNEGETGDGVSEITIAPIFKLTPNWSAMLEYRIESGDATYSGSPTTTLNGGTLDASQIALKTTLSF